MSARRKATDLQITEAYNRLGNVWLVAAEFGMCGQSVHERTVKLGINVPVNVFTEKDRKRLALEYQANADAGTLDTLADSLGRTKQFIARQAGEMGLTNRARKRPYHSARASAFFVQWHKENEHPRGMKGKRQTAAVCEAVSKASKARWASMTKQEKADYTLAQMKAKLAIRGTLATERNGTTWKSAWREIGGQRRYYRSKWEANYARYLEWLRTQGAIKQWEHEPETFWFEKIKRGVRSYLPDFRVTENNGSVCFHEVKGWMDDRSKTKLKRMKKYHPTVKLILIQEKAYLDIARKVGRMIPGWE